MQLCIFMLPRGTTLRTKLMLTSEVNVSTKQLVECYLLWHGYMSSMKRGSEGTTDLFQIQASAILPPGGNQYTFFSAWCMCSRFNISQYRTLKCKRSVYCSIFFAEHWEEYRVHSWLRVTEDIGRISEERKWSSPDSLISTKTVKENCQYKLTDFFSSFVLLCSMSPECTRQFKLAIHTLLALTLPCEVNVDCMMCDPSRVWMGSLKPFSQKVKADWWSSQAGTISLLYSGLNEGINSCLFYVVGKSEEKWKMI